jgi:hypothetical protein
MSNMAMVFALSLLASSNAAPVSSPGYDHLKKHTAHVKHALQELGEEKMASIPMHMYKQDCWKRRPIVLTQLTQAVFKKANKTALPGAGMQGADAIEPFVSVLKDGFSETACIKDYMFHHGDAFGSNKHTYEIAGRSNVSIVHYKAVVPSEDQKAMSQEVCFDFCRTVPDMLFFGLTHGRDCYCAPFFQMTSGDTSKCDSVCEGSPTTMCGGMTKSMIFEMHLCADTANDLSEVVGKAGDLATNMEGVGSEAETTAKDMQAIAAAGQDMFGKAGDPTASDLMQQGKVFAGEVQHAAEDTLKIQATLSEQKGKANKMKEGDFTSFEVIKEAESLIDDMEKTVAEGEASLETSLDLLGLAQGKKVDMNDEGEEGGKEGGEQIKQYKNIMYFVDPAAEEMPSTCGGDLIKKPMVAATPNDCALACDAEGIACAGFSYFGHESGTSDSICFLFTKFKETTYYTECGKGGFLQAGALKAKRAPEDVMCYAKFTSFSGTSIKPDPSGKCDKCLKKVNKAQRCFE